MKKISIIKLLHYSQFILFILFFIFGTSNSFSQVNFISPRSSDTLLTGRTTRIEWNNAAFTSGVSLYYSNDDGLNWILIADTLATDYYNWDIPLFDTLKLKLRLISDYSDIPVLLWEIPNAHNSEVRSVSLSPDGKFALSSGDDSLIRIWDLTTKITIDSLKMNNQNVFGAYQFHGIDTIIIAFDSTAVLWDRINRNTIVFGQGYFNNIVKSCAVNPNNPLFAAASYNGFVMLFSVQTGDTIASFHSDDYSNVYTCSFSNDGSILLFSSYSGDSYAYNVSTKSLIMKFNSDDRSGSRLVWSSVISPDNLTIVTGCVDGLVRLLDMNTGLIFDTLKGHTGQIRSLDYRTDGSVILSGSLDGTMRQWLIQNGQEVTNPINHGAQVLSCEYSSTGDTIISAGRDGSIKLWKNYKYHHYEDTLDCIVKYPLKVSIPDIYSKTGDFFRIQLMAESLEDIPNPNDKIIDFELKLEYPPRLIDFRDSSYSKQTTNSIDTVIIRVSSRQLSDTLANLLAIALFSSATSSRIKILDFDITNSIDYYIEKDDGSITLSSFCEGNTSREIQFSNSALTLNVYPQPSESELSIEMNLLEKGNHVLQLYDINGNFITDIIYENYSVGLQSIKINTQFLEPGYYCLLLKAPNEVKIKYVLIIR